MLRLRTSLTRLTALGLGLVVVSCSAAAPSGSTATHLGQRTKTTGCVVNGALADAACPPGAIIATATRDEICQPGYAKSVRDVPESEKTQVYDEYGIKT